MSNIESSIVADFRQTLLWPVQLISESNSPKIQRPWDILKAENCPWKEIQDEFSLAKQSLSEVRYQEFVTFMPFAQRFLYGEGKHGRESGGYGESPIHIFSRSDVNQVRITLDDKEAPIVLKVAHIELYFFYDIDVAFLALEVTGQNIPLQHAMEILYRLGRTYPNYWEENGDAGHCAKSIEWLTVFFDYPPAIRRVIYTTNAVESLNASLQKVLKPKKSFMDDEAMMKVIYLNAHRIASKWTMPVRDWGLALGQLAVMFGSDRVAL